MTEHQRGGLVMFIFGTGLLSAGLVRSDPSSTMFFGFILCAIGALLFMGET